MLHHIRATGTGDSIQLRCNLRRDNTGLIYLLYYSVVRGGIVNAEIKRRWRIVRRLLHGFIALVEFLTGDQRVVKAGGIALRLNIGVTLLHQRTKFAVRIKF